MEIIDVPSGNYTTQAYRLSTGRVFKANRLIIGLSPFDPREEDRWTVHEGYDGSLYMDPWDDEPEEAWTPQERAELADYMIALWTEYKVQALTLRHAKTV